MTRAHRFSAVIEQDGTFRTAQLPFSPGDRVEVIILAQEPAEASGGPRYPLQGTPYRFDDPFSPAVDPDEWEANQ